MYCLKRKGDGRKRRKKKVYGKKPVPDRFPRRMNITHRTEMTCLRCFCAFCAFGRQVEPAELRIHQPEGAGLIHEFPLCAALSSDAGENLDLPASRELAAHLFMDATADEKKPEEYYFLRSC
jgi:hypothetical protein